jgi:hypothetical protein
MDMPHLPDQAIAGAIFTGAIAAFGVNGTYQVASGDPAKRTVCDLLVTAGEPLLLGLGDAVLVFPIAPGRGIILGRIGPTSAPAPETPDELVLEAKSNLSLQCGDGSITIRKDGKILIKGKNLVSLAMETNRIKGGSVSIN